MKTNLTRLALAVLALVMVFALAACGNDDDNSLIGTTTADTTTQAPITTPADTTTVHVHEYIPTVVEPTCKDPGYTVNVCSCGDNYISDNVAAKDHTYGEWVTTTAATCTAAGVQTRVCSVCNTTETQAIAVAGHKYVSVVTAPTKTTQGYTVHTCSVCKDSYTDSYTNATGSQGLAYDQNSDGTLTITGMGLCTDKELIIYSTTSDGKTVTAIAEGAFAGNTTIKSVYLPSSITSIGEAAFAGCTSLSSITVEADNKNFSAVGGVLYNKDKTVIVAVPAGLPLTEYSIADSIKDIRASAFAGCANLTQFKLASNDNDIFYVASGVLYKLDKNDKPSTLIAYPAGNSAISFTTATDTTEIGDYAFYGAKKLRVVDIYGVETVGDHAFDSCTDLRSLDIPDTVEDMGEYAFANCTALLSVSFGKSLSVISDHAFENCSSLAGMVIIADTVEEIGAYAFANCTKIDTVVIGKAVEEIGERAFAFCTRLSTVLYKGDSTAWFKVDVHSSNTTVLTISADLYFYTTSTTKPSGGLDYWHYDANGYPSITWTTTTPTTTVTPAA
ncbi:MAG: leucine-rich repeat domain-containing protein [Clostridia bacterium]|nr:leucine-rich repeat domain-containing protein [Clostridia bacterium]